MEILNSALQYMRNLKVGVFHVNSTNRGHSCTCSPMRIESTCLVYWLLSHGFLRHTDTSFVKYLPKIMQYCFLF